MKTLDVVTTIFGEIAGDSDNCSKNILEQWNNSNAHDRDVIDRFLMSLCGWSMGTIIRIAESNKSYV